MGKNIQQEFLEAYEKYADAIYRHCYFRVYQKELAEDLTQETFIKTWKYIAEGKEVKNIKSFLYRVAVNLIIDNSRKKKEIYLEDIRLNNMGVEEAIFSHFEAGQIIKLLDELSEAQKKVVIMRYIDQLKPAEIAEILEESPNAVSVRLNHAVSRLRQISKIVYPFLGVRYVLVDEVVKQKYKLDQDYGALVLRGSSGEPGVVADSAADKAGLKENDLILEINGEKITKTNSMSKLVQNYNVGDKVTLKILRGGKEMNIDVILGQKSS